MHPQQLRKFVAPEIIFGVGALQLAGQYGRNLGGSKALIVFRPRRTWRNQCDRLSFAALPE